MTAYNFIYDGEALTDYGFIICTFDGPLGMETVSAGSEMTMNTVMQAEGRKYNLASVTYETPYEMTAFQICKAPICGEEQFQEDYVVTVDEYRDIMRWLNRKGYYKFRLDDDEWQGIYMEGTFNVSRIEIGGQLFGFELTLMTNRPYALLDEIVETLEFTSSNYTTAQVIYDSSDEIGYIYPTSVVVTLAASGDLTIYNSIESRTTQILNCTSGEVITMDCQHLIISSSLSAHDIATDFNYAFFRLVNTYTDRTNEITVSLPCTIEITYNPISKAVM